MLGPTDIQRLATMIDPERDGLEMGEVEEVDINHLDFGYVESCKNTKELLELLRFLKSGKEGFYPALEAKIQEKLAELDPIEHPLPLTRREQYQAKEEVTAELADWAASFPNQSKNTVESRDLKPIESLMRRSAISMPVNSKEKEPLMPKINIVSNGNEKALETVKDVYPVIKSNPEIPTNLTILQKQKYAENEKNKGNDCLRAGELADALHYYSTSLSLSPTVAVFNNRALCNLKLKHYEDAAKDCTSSMEIEVTFKALLRRALANLNLARYQQGTSDVDAALEMEPESKEGLLLRKQIVDKWMDEEKNRVGDIQNATKVKIEEVHTFPKIQKIFDDKEETPVVKPKINIIEVDEDDSDDDF